MINIKFKSCALFLFFVCTLSANTELSLIGGKINDINSGESLPYAKVTIKDPQIELLQQIKMAHLPYLIFQWVQFL